MMRRTLEKLKRVKLSNEFYYQKCCFLTVPEIVQIETSTCIDLISIANDRAMMFNASMVNVFFFWNGQKIIRWLKPSFSSPLSIASFCQLPFDSHYEVVEPRTKRD